MRLTVPRFHKWMGVTVGVIFLLWVVSGIVMILPPLPAPRGGPPAVANYSGSTLSPAQAVALVAGREADSGAVTSLVLLRLGNRSAYQITVKGGRSYLIDAGSGERVIITAELARGIAEENLGGDVPVRGVEELSHHDFRYPAGSLPVYRVLFADPRETVAYVATRDGSVRLSDWRHRVRATIGGLHTFQPVELLTGSDSLRVTLLHLASLISIALIATGYYMSLPKRRGAARPPD
jgi:uncharacterized iron-regulated membrane protein